MPELPEVTQVQRHLQGALYNRRIDKVRIYSKWVRIPDDLRERLYRQRCQDVLRHGKYLFFVFNNDILMVHLGMSGSFRVVERDKHHIKHDHYAFLTRNAKIFYKDPRRFGRMDFLKPEDIKYLLNTETVDLPGYNLGIDAMNPSLDPKHSSAKLLWQQWFFDKFLGSAPIKQCLMNQNGIAGIGNIYASEILFAAGIHPLARLDSLTRYQRRQLVKHCWKILRHAIRYGGTTIEAANRYQDPSQKEGNYSQYLSVYGREGEPCQNCDGVVHKKVIRSRATYYCPVCQSQ